MSNEFEPAQTPEASPAQDNGALHNSNQPADTFSIENFAAEFLQQHAPETLGGQNNETFELPSEPQASDGDVVEDIEEQTTPTEDEQVLEEGGVLTYDDLSGQTIEFNVGGETRQMTLDHIASELGRVKAATEARAEVEHQWEQIDLQRNALQEEMVLLQRQQATIGQEQQLAKQAAEIQAYEQQLNNARQKGDTNAIVQLKDAIDVLTQNYHHNVNYLQQEQQMLEGQLVEQQKNVLQQIGYGEILSDPQRLEQLTVYANDYLSPSAANAVQYDATLLATVEKARLWDKAQANKSKRKPTKTLRSGGLKPSKPAQKTTGNPFQDISNKVFGV